MDCDVIRDLLPMYADGQACEASRRAIEKHAAGCPGCQKLLNQMCTPIEPEPEDRQQQILEKIYKKQRKKIVVQCLIVLLAVLVAVWAVLETRFQSEQLYAASTNEEKILKEMPALALTQEELALAQSILEIPLIRDSLSKDSQDLIILETELLPELAVLLPENGRFIEVFVCGASVGISIVAGKQYTYLTYADSDFTGHIDVISKTVAVSSLDEIGTDGNLGDVGTVYELRHAVGTQITQCTKWKTRHIWFDFLNMSK